MKETSKIEEVWPSLKKITTHTLTTRFLTTIMTEDNNKARYAIVIIILLCIMYIYKQIIIVTTYQNDNIQPTPTDQASSVLIKRPASIAGLDPRTRILRLLPTKTDILDEDSISSLEQDRSRTREG